MPFIAITVPDHVTGTAELATQALQAVARVLHLPNDAVVSAEAELVHVAWGSTPVGDDA